MCGIAGIWTNQLDPRVAEEKVRTMTSRLAHRGPDDGGVEMVAAPNGDSEGVACVVLGHRRLSIIDLSAAGHQPMQDPVSGNWITYNGEIYNYLELRRELEALGAEFKSQSDTEVILKAYAQWGFGAWRRLRGIFALGLWDGRLREMHLVRDHLGVKPLYWARTSAGLAFASEVRALLAAQWVPNRLSLEALAGYLKYGSVQEPTTMIEGVVSLPPGTWLVCEASGRVRTHAYWQVAECVQRNWAEQPRGPGLLPHLEDTVRRQLVADVPVGVFLSGGLDSAAIAALAARERPGGIQTFCIGSDNPQFDESAEAAETAQALGCRHSTLMLEGRMVREGLGRALACYDQPSADGLNTYFISMLVRQAGIKVALSGLGGDELFVGYTGFRKSLFLEKAGRVRDQIPLFLRDVMAEVLGGFSPVGSASAGGMAELFEPEPSAPYFSSRTHFCRRHMARLSPVAAASVRRRRSAWQEREGRLTRLSRHLQPVDRVGFLELQTYMLSTLLRDADQMSMAHALELRVPFVDPAVVEQVQPVPAGDKTALGLNKRLLAEAVGPLLPAAVVSRRKRGFTLPFQQWFRRELQEPVGACFMAEDSRGPWDRLAFRGVWKDFRAGRVAWSRVLPLYTLENWMQENRVTV